MRRRRLLRSAGAAVAGTTALAGCIGAPDPGAEETPTDGGQATEEGTTAGGGSPTEPMAGTATETPTTAPAETPTGTSTGTPTRTPEGTPTRTGQQPGAATQYRFGGRVQGWVGREPQRIADAQNPTISLTAGADYEVTWENLDGVPHNFTIWDSAGNVLAQTETMSEEGATRTLRFTATREMAQYVCTIHPTTMVGDIEVTTG